MSIISIIDIVVIYFQKISFSNAAYYFFPFLGEHMLGKYCIGSVGKFISCEGGASAVYDSRRIVDLR